MWKIFLFAVISIIWAFKASDGFEKLGKNTGGCNKTLNQSNGGFALNEHKLDKECYWIITNKTHAINLMLTEVFLDKDDHLGIYKTLEDAQNSKNAIWTSTASSFNGSLTIITNKTELIVYLKGSSAKYDRICEGYYSAGACSFPVSIDTAIGSDVGFLNEPTYLKDVNVSRECLYRFNEIQHERVTQVFTFKEFDMSSSKVSIEESTLDFTDYTNESPPTDFFMAEGKNLMTITVKQALNSSDHFKLKMHKVDKACSGKIQFSAQTDPLKSPPYETNNGSITVHECRYLIVDPSSSDKIGLKFDTLDFRSVFDILAINDGLSENSPPLLQVTTSNRNITQNQIIRSQSSSLWVAFKPLTYESRMEVTVTAHKQGGYFKNSGDIKMQHADGDDTAFLLEVDKNEVVMLEFQDSSITPPAAVYIYDGFDTSNLLACLHGQVKYPILSRSSRMLVTGTKFNAVTNQFSATFKGVVPGCNHMSSASAENYVLSENCNSSCTWVIPPQNSSNSVLVLYLQFVSLKEGDSIKIHKLDASLTQLAEIRANDDTYVPHVAVPGDIGMLVNVTQACENKTDKVVLIGHSSYIPGCSTNIAAKSTEFLQISSPLYPDTYPVFSNCQWNISIPKESIAHMSFQKLNLAKNHCIKIIQNTTKQYEGKTLPDDLFFAGNVRLVFDSTGCNKSEVGSSLNSDAGFLLNVTVTDCGAVLEGKKSGEFSTSVSGSKTICIWKVSVPATDGSPNIISYNISDKDKLKNYEFHVYDGSSVRDSDIENNTGPHILSRTNTLIFVYKRIDVLKPSGVLDIKFAAQACDSLCDNKVCMHPDWRCNGKNNCGDFSDERNCGAVPIPPELKETGYSATAFWLSVFAMLVIGTIAGVTVPVCLKRYRDSRYNRFQPLET